MDSSKQQNVSRQSSILKLPKQRQPLQCVTSDPSSLDDGPTAKIKRRVSFARNRRIKEFCNETEQETVWDNTYEEHDLSSTKSSTNSTHDQPLIITVPCYDKENFPVQLFLPTNEINCTELQSNITEEPKNTSQYNTEIEGTSGGECAKLNGDHELSDATIYCNDGMDLTTLVLPTEDSPFNNEEKVQNFDTSNHSVFPLNKNLEQDIYSDVSKINAYSVATSMDLLKPMIHSNNNSKEKTENVNIFESTEKDITDTVPISRTELYLSSKEHVDKREIYTNVSMEMTEAVQGRRNYNLIEVPSSNAVIQDKMNVYCDTSMEITEAVLKPSHQKLIQPSLIPQLINKSVETNVIHNYPPIETLEQTKIFNNSKMDITETVPISRTLLHPSLRVPIDRNKMTANISMELTEAVQSIRDFKPSQVPPSTLVPQDKLNKYCDTSMEMTEAVLKTSHQNLVSSLHMPKLINKSMELTEVVPSSNFKDHTTTTATEKTTIFNNSNMNITETVPVSRSQFYPSQTTLKDKTNIYENLSMEITEAVPKKSDNKCLQGTTSKSVQQDKLNVYCDISMEMTEAVSKSTHQNLVSSLHMPKLINKSMELTEVVPSRNLNHNARNIVTEKTKIFNNSNMDMTETVPVSKNQIYTLQTTLKDKTKNYENLSMEITEAVPTKNDNNWSRGLTSKPVPQDKLNKYCDTSMEMTEAVLKSSHQNFVSSLHMPKLINKSMELTEVVPSSNFKYHATSTATEKTTIFNNSNMNITETVPVSRGQFSQIISKDKTNIYENLSMEITEAVPKRSDDNFLPRPASKSVLQDELKVYCDTSMEMTEAVSKSTQQNLISSIYVPKSINKSMELTEVVPSRNLNQGAINTVTEKTKIFNNSNMDMTETVPVSKNQIYTLQTTLKDKTKHFENLSMEITEAVPTKGDNNWLQGLTSKPLPQDKLNVYCDTSMEMTEAISKSKRQNLISSLSIPKLINKSMELTEAVGNNLIINKSITKDVKKDTNIERNELKDLSPHQIKSYGDEISSTDGSNLSSKLISGPSTLDKSNSQFYKISSSTKVYHDDSMEMTNVLLNPKTLNSSNLSRLAFGTEHNKTNVDVERCNSNQKEKSFQSMYDLPKNGEDSLEYSDLPTVLTNFTKSSFQANSFQRITSDELHTLCASLNLPTQKYNREENITSQNNFFGVCNDVNILRNSLRNNTLFKSQRNMMESLGISKNEEILSIEPNNLDKSINSRLVRNMDSEEQHLTDIQRSNLVTNMSLSEAIVNPALKSSLFRDDCDITITKTNLIGQQPLISTSDRQETEVINNGSTLHQTSSGLTDVFQACVKLDKKSIHGENVTTPSGTSLNDCVDNKIIQKDIQKIDDENEYKNTSHFTQSTSSIKRKSCDNVDNFNKSSKRCNYENSSPKNSHQDFEKNKSSEVSLENSQNKISSDNIEILVTDKNFETCTLYPEKVNDNTIQKVSEQSFSNKTLFNGIENVVLPSLEDETRVISNGIESENSNYSSLKDNEINECPTNDQSKDAIEVTSAEEEIFSKIEEMNKLEHSVETKESEKVNISDSSLQLNLQTEPHFQDLEDIQPPSFLNCNDSTQEEWSNQNNGSLTKNIETFSNNIMSSTLATNENHDRFLEESNVDTTHEEIVSPVMQLINNISEQEKRDDCIWSVCKMDSDAININFLSKSMVITLLLNNSEFESHSKDIKSITFKSRLRENSSNTLLKIAHNLLLKKLESEDLLHKYKMFDEVLPLLDYVANEVIFIMDFIFDLEKLNSLYLMKIETERISFKVASKKTSIILDVSIPIKQINRINADDVQVKCILGNIRIKDIKKLIENTKKDYKFLSRYIEYVQEYITLIEDSISFRKY